MSDIKALINRRKVTRTKATKLVNKAIFLINEGTLNEDVSVTITLLDGVKQMLKQQNDEIAELVSDEDIDNETDSIIEYDTRLETTLEALRKMIVVKSPEKESDSLNKLTRILGRQNELTQSLSLAQERATLPKLEPDVFDGKDVTKFRSFMQSFERMIRNRTDNDADRLVYLEHYTRGMARELVKSCGHMDPTTGFQRAICMLNEKYGDEFAVANAYMQQIDSWPNLRAEDASAIEKFSVFLTSCGNYMEDISSLNQLNSPKQIYEIIQKLPYNMREKWRSRVGSIRERGECVNFKEVVKFIQAQSSLLNMPIFGCLQAMPDKRRIPEKSQLTVTNKSSSFVTYGHKPKIDTVSRASDTQNKRCYNCSSLNHELIDCVSFKQKSMNEKRDLIKRNYLCFGCLRPGHHSRGCWNRHTCNTCHRRHPTCLHEDRVEIPDKKPEAKTHATGTVGGNNRKIALALVPVKVRVAGQRESTIVYAGLDNFSTDCFISEETVQKLGIQGTRTEIQLTTMEKVRSPTSTKVIQNLEISDLDENETVILPPLYTVPKLPLSQQDIVRKEDIEQFPHLSSIPLDYVNASIGLLIGANAPEVIKPLKIVEGPAGQPYASQHRIGWAINGPISHSDAREVKVHRTQVESMDQLEQQIQRMYLHDYTDCGQNESSPSADDVLWRRKVESGIRFEDGHYTIELPFRHNTPTLPDNRQQAVRHIQHLHRKLASNHKFRDDYVTFMNRMEERGHAERVPENELKSRGNSVWYLVHHGVYQKGKDKLRVVFNCSAKYQGISLNDELLPGPDLTNTLIGVLIRFRQDPVAFTADIEQMFYQVKTAPNHRDYLRFLWFPQGDIYREAVEYRITVHVFGAVSSPSCANYALRQIAEDNNNTISSVVANTIRNNFYVDDLLKSVETPEEAASLCRDMHEACRLGGFHLTKFVTNSTSVLSTIPSNLHSESKTQVSFAENFETSERALGVKWDTNTDTIGCSVRHDGQAHTRREILSIVSSVYDPLGLLGPSIIPGKAIFQMLCSTKTGWDEAAAPHIQKKLNDWISNLPVLENYRIDRCLRPFTFAKEDCQIHIFSDASEQGYGAVAYIRFETNAGDCYCNIILAKSRLSPLKKITIPRLELTAAKLAVTLKNTIKRELEFKVKEWFFWTDSVIVIKYLNNTTTRFQRFVANRVEFIREYSDPAEWNHISSEHNPADYASRGMSAKQFVNTKEWKNGPDMLWKPQNTWKVQPVEFQLSTDDKEIKKCTPVTLMSNTSACSPSDKLIESTSTWWSLKRKIAWILKIKECLRTKKKLPPRLSLNDLENAQHAIFSYIQNQHFADEIKRLKSGKPPRKHSELIKLHPIFRDNLLCVGGRLSRANIPTDAKHPPLIPKNHHVAKLIIGDEHRALGCLGKNAVLSSLRQKVWIIGAKSTINRISAACLKCKKRHGKPFMPLMSDLPIDRLEGDNPPFTNVGVDLFGPFYVTIGRRSEKRYGVIFTCLNCRAIHLEIAQNLETDAFINCLRRFIARRGQVKKIRCDRGTNLVGAQNDLKKELDNLNNSALENILAQQNIEWSFNPPAASHFGGIWERQIRSIRNVFESVLQSQHIRLNDDSLNTLMCETESILNNRPITTVSDDPNDLEPLTPNHLLLLRNGPTFPPGLFSVTDLYARKRWKQVQYLADLFWTRWKKEYMTNLQIRQKWYIDRPSLRIGDLVLVLDSSLPRNKWPMGRVKDVTPSSDGKIRVATVVTIDIGDYSRSQLIKQIPRFRTLVRPVSKLIPLESFD